MSAVACWIRWPVLRIFLPKKSMKNSTTGKVQKANSVSFQSRYTMAQMEPMRTEVSVMISTELSTMALCMAWTSLVT